MTRPVLVLLAAAAVASPPRAQAQQKATDARNEFFAANKVVKLDLEIDPKGMDSLRRDARTYVPAKVTEDGKTVYAAVGVHLRGTAGSFRGVDDRPGLTLNMDKFTDGQRFHGMDKLHLNNSAQDGTFIQELLCGELFRAAGVPAARVTHAVVTLNGRKLGFYYLKEGYDKGWLKENFKESGGTGNFYDGGFLRDIDQPLELNSGKNDVKDHADLKAVVAACREGDHAKRFQKLEQLLDLDKFLAMTALEVVLWDWDGYPMKPNNYRVYHDPKANKLVFVPSGMDQMWGDPNGTIFPGFGGMVARALLETTQGKQRYLAKTAEVMDRVYKPDAMLKRLDELQAKVQPALKEVDPGAGNDYPNRINWLRGVIPHRAKNVAEQLKQHQKK